MSNSRNWILVILAITLLSGCVTRLYKEPAKFTPSGETGYVAGNFLDTEFYLFGFLFGSPFKLVIRNSDTDKKYSFNFSTKDEMMLFSLPVGNYYVESISKTESYQDSSGYTHTTVTHIQVPKELLFDFKVAAGKTTFLGYSRLYSEGFWIFKKFYLEYQYDFDPGRSELAEKYLNIDPNDIISYQ